mgnify:CR=1 FL=1|tara:strand:+ start:10457 stop:12193 length:1737 start_codon:yes stop_codon:yes gene_type:complete
MIKTKYLAQYPKKILSTLEKNNIVWLFIYLVLSILISFVETLGLGVLAIFVGFISDPEIILNKIPQDDIKDYLLSLNFNKLIFFTACFIIIIFLLKNFFIFIFNIFELKLKKKILITKSEKIFNQLLKKNYEFFTKYNSAKFIHTVNSEVNRVVNFIFSYFIIFREIVFLLILFIPLVFIDFKISLFGFIIIVTISLIFLNFVKPKFINLGEKARKHNELMLSALREVIDTIGLIKLTEKYSFFINKYSNQLNLVTEYNNKKRILQLFPRIFLELLAIISILLISLFMISVNIEKELLLSTLSFIALVAVRMIPVIQGFNIEISNSMYNQKAFDRYFEEKNINLKDQIFDKKIDFKESIKSIEFKNVFFKYTEDHNYILKNISFKIESDSIIGIHGKSGSGKTSLIKLIMGLLEPLKGEMLVNSKSIDFSKESIGKQIGYVPQDIFLVDGPLSTNIALQQNKTDINYEKLKESILNSNLTSLVASSNNDYNLNIVDRGFNLSGGQKQRIGIARALYLNPNILILDEPNNNLDINSSEIIKKNLNNLKKNKIIIVISHSKNFLSFCDKNFFIRDGILEI